jgi:hypothetical protein
MCKKSKFIEKIKELWAKVVAWVKGASSKVDDFIVKYAPVAITVINSIKDFNQSSAADVIEFILANVKDKYGAAIVPMVRKWLEENLPKVIDALNLASNVAQGATIAEKIIAAQEAIKLLPESMNATMWANLSALLANYLADDGKLSISEALAIIGYIYENNLNK